MSDDPAPLMVRYEGEGAFSPSSSYWAKRADRQYVIGQIYEMVPHQDRSDKSHRAFFASVNEAWNSLPAELNERWPSAEHLRKWCLIKRGFCKTQTTVFANRKDAEKAAAIIAPLDEFSIVDVRDMTLTRSVAESQSYRAMGKQRFNESQNAVREEIALILGTTPQDIEAAKEAA